MLEDVLERFGILSLSDCSVGFEDILYGRMHIGFEGQVDELILREGRSTASF